jgi:hypothetical protein
MTFRLPWKRLIISRIKKEVQVAKNKNWMKSTCCSPTLNAEATVDQKKIAKPAYRYALA